MSHFFSRHSLITFLILVFVVEWAISPFLIRLSPVAIGLIAFLPTPVASFVAALAEGNKGARKLLRLSLAWRIRGTWYLLAILIPVVIHASAAGLAVLFGGVPDLDPGILLAYLPVTLILAVGEEIGWHGYALPKLRTAFSPWLSALLFGSVHAAFHLPMFLLPLPDELRQASPFGLFLLMATAFAFYRVWFYERTRGNVPLAIVYHAAINTSVLLLNGVDRELLGWLLPAVWVTATLPLVFAGGLSEMRKPEAEPLVA